MQDLTQELKIYEKACLSRLFEDKVFNLVKNGVLDIPVYLSSGHEYISAVMSEVLSGPHIFAQHRAHHTYLSYGGDINKLILELMGSSEGCSGGKGGSASIQSKEIKMFGHDGLMGSQIPIAVGYALTSNHLTLAIMGDASAEEDYVMSSIAWAGKKKLPILFLVEDNNLSILTEKSVRRDWSMSEFARSVNVNGMDSTDSPYDLYDKTLIAKDNLPALLNVNTIRNYWHCGAGKDDGVPETQFEKQEERLGSLSLEVKNKVSLKVELTWQKHLEAR